MYVHACARLCKCACVYFCLVCKYLIVTQEKIYLECNYQSQCDYWLCNVPRPEGLSDMQSSNIHDTDRNTSKHIRC